MRGAKYGSVYFPTNLLTVRPAERHMGWDKGSPEYRVQPHTFRNGRSPISAEQLFYSLSSVQNSYTHSISQDVYM